MKVRILVIGLISLYLSGCTKERIVTQVKLVKIKPPVITQCQRLTIQECKPVTNGDLYECTLSIQKNLNLCADQVDALIKWQEEQVKK